MSRNKGVRKNQNRTSATKPIIMSTHLLVCTRNLRRLIRSSLPINMVVLFGEITCIIKTMFHRLLLLVKSVPEIRKTSFSALSALLLPPFVYTFHPDAVTQWLLPLAPSHGRNGAGNHASSWTRKLSIKHGCGNNTQHNTKLRAGTTHGGP